MNRRALAVLALVALMTVGGLPQMGAAPSGDLGDPIDTVYVEDPDPWVDTLDDLTHVYVPSGGLTGLSVSDGSAHLRASKTEGWIATEVITCPPGNRFDLVVLDVMTPGDSTVEISILDPTSEATEVGYANGTIDLLRDVEGATLKVRSIDTDTYPGIRIQVTLKASGADRPVLNGLSLYYSAADEWRDDLVSEARMDTIRNLNMTDGTLEIDLSKAGGASTRSGGMWPMIALDHYSTGGTSVVDLFLPNYDNSGYGAVSTVPAKGTRGVALGDLNGDGYDDLVMANAWYNSANVDSEIHMGTSSGFNTNAPTKLGAVRAFGAELGDFNGDGDLDIALACTHASLTVSSMVFLNQGGGEFTHEPTITFSNQEYGEVEGGDINGDGYDDIMFIGTTGANLFLGGSSGPSTSPVTIINPSGYIHDTWVGDLDGDGYDDFIMGNPMSGDNMPVYLGSAAGLDSTVDYMLAIPDDEVGRAVGVGDMNGDGINEIVAAIVDNFQKRIYIYEGTSTGWSGNDLHIVGTADYTYALDMADVNGDGYSDILAGVGSDFEVFFGGDSWPIDHDISKSASPSPSTIAIAGGSTGSTSKFKGRMVTETITLPMDKRWDILSLEGTFPEGTSATVTILDDNGAPLTGFKEMDRLNVDLRGLNSRHLAVEIWLNSESNKTTPSLDTIRVKWQDPEVWREEFFGDAKVDAMLGTKVAGRHLTSATTSPSTPDLLFTSMRGDEGYSTSSMVFTDADPLDYTTNDPIVFPTRGAMTSAAADVNDDGYTDIVFGIHRSGDSTYQAKSPLYLGTPVGWNSIPDHEFPTTGVTDILLEDLNGDGHIDVVFAQERDGDTYMINSTVFWGSAGGWSDRPDVQLQTTGASGVVAADVDEDGDRDLVFSCYKSTTTATDSMVFIQSETGFDVTSSDIRLAGHGATSVDAADLDNDGYMDIVLANSFYAGSAEIASYIYWGMEGSSFGKSPTHVPTSGATDVEIADVDGDGDADLVFANAMANSGDHNVSSYVYLNDGSGGFASTPDHTLQTVGASSVEIADMDGTGWMDLVFACRYNGTSYAVPSLVYLGGRDGWSTAPDIELPTEGATDVLVRALVRPDGAGYLSQRITPTDIHETGAFHTLKYTGHMEGSRSASISMVDADTWETLAQTNVLEGTNEWLVEGTFDFRAHSSVRVMVTMSDMDKAGEVWVDDLGLNWTPRVHMAPVVLDLTVTDGSIYRTHSTTLTLSVMDEFTSLDRLAIDMEHSIEGADEWNDFLLGKPVLEDGVWTVPVLAKTTAPLGTYVFRVQVTDGDGDISDIFEVGATLDVLNNLPGTPEIRLSPARPVTTSVLRAEVVKGATDVESNRLTYIFTWFCNGELQEDLTSNTVLAEHTRRGQNWSVEVRAFDGDDNGQAVTMWREIANAPPAPSNPLPDPYFDEDTTDSDWLDLSMAFEDSDGDPITWSLKADPVHLTVEIDHATGKVTLVPEEDWNGEEELTFIASDGELQGSQTVTVNVQPINDLPRFVAVDGRALESDMVEYTIGQGETLIVHVSLLDVEGHELVIDLNTSLVEWNAESMELTFKPDNSAVGTLRFGMRMNDVVSPTEKVALTFAITVENANDPMDDPKIVRPVDGDLYEVNQTFSLVATCFDPDIVYGQILNFSWSSSISGPLGFGSSLTISMAEEGNHVIILRVNDGEFEKTTSIQLIVEAEEPVDDPTGGDPTGGPDNKAAGPGAGSSTTGLLLGVLVIIGAASAGLVAMRARRKVDDDTDGADADPELTEEQRRQVLTALAGAAREAADVIENGKNGNGHDTGIAATSVETHDERNGIDVDRMEVSDTTLSIEAKVTEVTSEDVAALWEDIAVEVPVAPASGTTPAPTPAPSPDSEELRVDNLKRKYQNVIASLPYGIPSKELQDWDWVDLACALATGEKKMAPGNGEVTRVGDRWYHSDIEDASTFLKEHGAKPKVDKSSRPAGGDAAAELEEMLIMGRITEEDYKRLKQALKD